MATQTENQTKRDVDLKIKKTVSQVPYELVNKVYIISHSLT